MADCETGEPRLDSETGEERDTTIMSYPALVRCREAKTVQVTVATDAETGENEWNTTSSSPSVTSETRRRSTAVFHIPQSLLRDNLSNDKCLTRVICLLPALLFFPALTVAICLFTEISMHCWFHKWERKRKAGESIQCYHLSPLHTVVRAFCAHCQSDRLFQEIGKVKARKYQILKMKLKNESCCKMQSQVVS